MVTSSLTQIEDSELMNRLVANDLESWSELVQRYGDLVYSVAFQILHNENDSEDAVQNTFVRIKIYAGKFDQSQPLKPWISRIASGEAIRIYNKKKEIKKKESASMDTNNILNLSPKKEASDIVEQKEVEVMVKKAIESLPETSRVALTLYYAGGMNQSEIAKELGISQVRISLKIKSGLEMIKAYLKKSGIHASIILSANLLEESIVSVKLPYEFKQKLTQSLPSNSQLETVMATKVKSSSIGLKLKSIFIYLTCSVTLILVGGIYLNFHSKEAEPKGQISNLKIVKTIIKSSMQGDIKKTEKILAENIFYPVDYNNFNFIQLKNLKYMDNLKLPEVIEIEAQNLGSQDLNILTMEKANWKLVTNNLGKISLVRSLNEKKGLDGLYFDQMFNKPFIFKGKIKIFSKNCRVSFIISTQKKAEEFNLVSDDTKNLISNASITSAFSTLQSETGNEIDFIIYTWFNNNKLFAVSFAECKGYPRSLVGCYMPKIIDEFKFGILSNGKIEVSNFEFCPLSKNWDYRTAKDITDRINEFPNGFFEDVAMFTQNAVPINK